MENEQIVIELKELLYEVMMQPKASRELLAAWPGLKNNYHDYMITEPIDFRKELNHVPEADYDICCALLTMIVQEKENQDELFESYVYNSDVIRILNRMIKLQQKL